MCHGKICNFSESLGTNPRESLFKRHDAGRGHEDVSLGGVIWTKKKLH